ncbi:MAG: hypothetical protein WDM96_03905 [Lacunisphaera sp.]
MPDLAFATITSALAGQSLFEDKSWRLSPQAWPLTPDQLAELNRIGAPVLNFTRRSRPSTCVRWRAKTCCATSRFSPRGSPTTRSRQAGRSRRPCAQPEESWRISTVLRPDLLLTEEGFALTELDSVPGGIGLTAFLNRLYGGESDAAIVGHRDAMIENFHQSLAGLRPDLRNPLIAILVSDEAATYRPEMQWLAEQLQTPRPPRILHAPRGRFSARG